MLCHRTLPSSTLPSSTLPYPTLPYLTLPYPILPYPTLHLTILPVSYAAYRIICHSTRRLYRHLFCFVRFLPCPDRVSSASASLPQINAEPPPDSVLYLVCFHLPVSLKKDWKGTWQAEWNESLIAKTEHRYAVCSTTVVCAHIGRICHDLSR